MIWDQASDQGPIVLINLIDRDRHKLRHYGNKVNGLAKIAIELKNFQNENDQQCRKSKFDQNKLNFNHGTLIE